MAIISSLSLAISSFLTPANAMNIRQIGDIPTSGFIFKDSLKLMSFQDPKIPGITIYLSDFDRPITEKLTSNFFDDPSSSSVTCVQTGPAGISKNNPLSEDRSGEEIFEESRNLFFKQIRIRRVYDKETNTVVYVSYATRLSKSGDENKSRFKSSLCAVHLSDIP